MKIQPGIVELELCGEARLPRCFPWDRFLIRILLAAAVTAVAGSQAYRLAFRVYVPYSVPAASGIAPSTAPLFSLAFVDDDAVNIMWRMAVVSATMSAAYLIAVTALCGRPRILWRFCLFLLNLGFLVGAISGMSAYVARGYLGELADTPANAEPIYRDVCVGAIAWLPVGCMFARNRSHPEIALSLK